MYILWVLFEIVFLRQFHRPYTRYSLMQKLNYDMNMSFICTSVSDSSISQRSKSIYFLCTKHNKTYHNNPKYWDRQAFKVPDSRLRSDAAECGAQIRCSRMWHVIRVYTLCHSFSSSKVMWHIALVNFMTYFRTLIV